MLIIVILLILLLVGGGGYWQGGPAIGGSGLGAGRAMALGRLSWWAATPTAVTDHRAEEVLALLVGEMPCPACGELLSKSGFASWVCMNESCDVCCLTGDRRLLECRKSDHR